jgi:uncharacterized protein with HEPN domain
MRPNKDLAYLDDIREACALVADYVRGKTLVDFVGDRLLQDAVIRRLGIIGEASKSLSAKGKGDFPGVAWKDMGRLRDLLVHHYWRVGLPEIWTIATADVSELLGALTASSVARRPTK